MLKIILFLVVSFFSLFLNAQSLSETEVADYAKAVKENAPNSVDAAYKLAFYYRHKIENAEDFRDYCLYVIENTKATPLRFERLSAHRLLSVYYLQNNMPDSMNYHADNLLKATEKTKDTLALEFRSRLFNIKAGEHLFYTYQFEKAFPLLIESMEIAEKIENANSYLEAAYSLCYLTLESEPTKIINLVEEVEQKIKGFQKSSKPSDLFIRKTQKFKHIYIAQNSENPKERAESLNFYRQLIRDTQKGKLSGTPYKDMVEMTQFFPEELGKDSVLYFTSLAYDHYKKNNYPVEPDLYYRYGKALIEKGEYERAIPVLKEIIPLCGIKDIGDKWTDEPLEGDYKLLTNIYKSLSFAYSKLGRSELFEKYFSLYNNAIEKRRNQDVNNTISEIETKYETEKKEKENQALVTKNNLIQTRFRLSSIIGILLLFLLVTSIFFYLKMRQNKKELEHINENKNQLFEIIAHDLKGPVSSFSELSLNISHLIQTNQTDRLLELAGYYEKAGRRINFILTNLLDWAISQKDHFVNSPENLDVRSEVNTIIKELDYYMMQKNIKINNQVNPNNNFFFDKNAFKVIIRNLLHNSMKFSHRDSSIVIDHDEFGIKIKDNGIGLKPETIKKIMKKERVNSDFGTDDEKGNGIGLSTCLKLADQNNAKLDINSKFGEGAVFTLSLLD